MEVKADGPGRDDGAAADRALTAQWQARELAERLADTARDIAATLDRVAATREARAAQLEGAEAALTMQRARRARERADVERHDDRELRRTWRLPGA